MPFGCLHSLEAAVATRNAEAARSAAEEDRQERERERVKEEAARAAAKIQARHRGGKGGSEKKIAGCVVCSNSDPGWIPRRQRG